jgi:hypothetical protein
VLEGEREAQTRLAAANIVVNSIRPDLAQVGGMVSQIVDPRRCDSVGNCVTDVALPDGTVISIHPAPRLKLYTHYDTLGRVTGCEVLFDSDPINAYLDNAYTPERLQNRATKRVVLRYARTPDRFRDDGSIPTLPRKYYGRPILNSWSLAR